MRRPPLRHLLIGLAMLAAAGLELAMVPRKQLADLKPRINLDTLIPRNFGDWHVDEQIIPVKPSPDVQATVRRTYTQTLARTYINSRGQAVMLSIAYARVSYDGLETHVPEVCYPSQGFQLHGLHQDHLKTAFGNIPVKELVATRWSRTEPVTYWTVVGKYVVTGGWPWRLAQVRYGLNGIIPDNMLMRVSSIDADASQAYTLQNRFVEALLTAVGPGNRNRLIGQL